MPIPSPFHSRISALATSQEWREWSGYYSIAKYNATHEREYYSVRSAAGLFDVSPLFKYEITGPDALRLVDRIMTRDITKCQVGQVMYSPWCDEEGKVIDDGTISRLGENRFRITAADPSYRWFEDCGYGMDVDVQDISAELGALAIQGPKSREILMKAFPEADVENLKYYWLTQTQSAGYPLSISRTGYTGDLGYEVWVSPEHAEKLWDRLAEIGQGYQLTPIGLIVLDMLRVEAGLILIEVDYISTFSARIESQKSSPYDIGLGWTVKLNAGDFIGKKALVAENKNGPKWSFVGLDIYWPDLEQKFGEVNLPPQIPGQASRSPLPVYKSGRQIGQMTSISFSPILKKYIAIGTIEREYAQIGQLVDLEVTVEYSRDTVRATIADPSFFNPTRKRA